MSALHLWLVLFMIKWQLLHKIPAIIEQDKMELNIYGCMKHVIPTGENILYEKLKCLTTI